MRELIEATGFSRGGGDTDAGYSSSKRTFLIKDRISSFSFLGFGQGCGMLWDDGGDAEKSEEWKGKKSSRNKKDGGQGGKLEVCVAVVLLRDTSILIDYRLFWRFP